MAKVTGHDLHSWLMTEALEEEQCGRPQKAAKLREWAESLRPQTRAYEALLNACIVFVHKVETGRAQSRESYAQMKAAIALAEGR